MSARRRPPTDELATEIYDSQQGQRTRVDKPTKKGFESGRVEIGTPTDLDPPKRAQTEPMRVISMKTPAEVAAGKMKRSARQHKPQIRLLSEVVASKSATPPHGMGFLAPPADPKERNVRKLRDWLIWGSVLVIISCVVMLAVWFIAER
jgi:hypothetical protein